MLTYDYSNLQINKTIRSSFAEAYCANMIFQSSNYTRLRKFIASLSSSHHRLLCGIQISNIKSIYGRDRVSYLTISSWVGLPSDVQKDVREDVIMA